MNEVVTEDGEVIQGGLPAVYDNQSLAVQLARAEVDQQILTSRAFPRSVQRALGNIFSLATMSEETAKSCIYALPRGGKPIRGASIRLAEIVAGQWGNCRVGARVVHVDRDEGFIESEGVFHDLETNTATTMRVRRRILDKNGRLFTEDMIIVTGNAANSIAKRNAILGGVPRAVWQQAYDRCEEVLKGNVKTLVERRDGAMKAFAAFGVKPEQVYEALGVAGVDEVTLDHVVTLTGMYSALKNGESTVEDMFAKAPIEGKAKSVSKLDELANGGKAKDAPADDEKAPAPAKKAKSEKKQNPPADDAKSPPPASEEGEDGAGGETESSDADSASPPAATEKEKPDPREPQEPADAELSERQLEKAFEAGKKHYAEGKARGKVPEPWSRPLKRRSVFLEGYDEAEASDPENNRD